MNFFTGILIGVLVGWLVEWVIDWLFWRKDDSAQRLQDAEAEAARLRLQLKEQAEKWAQAQTEANRLRAQLADADETIEILRQQLDEAARKIPLPEDRLELVKGIGVVFAGKLKAAGIRTFSQLAALSPAQIRDIIQPEEWQKIDPESWILQAQALAEKQSRQKSA